MECGKTQIDTLQKLQNRAARIVANNSYDASAAISISEIMQNECTSQQIILHLNICPS